MKIGDLVRWQGIGEYELEDDYSDFGIVIAIDVWELSQNEQVIIGVLFGKIGFVWANPMSLEVVSAGPPAV